MSQPTLLRALLLWCATTLLTGSLLIGCGGDTDDSGDSNTTEDNPWEALLEGEPGVLLSVWGRSSSDIWVAGADAGDGPELHHWDGSTWSEPDPGVSGDLWWLFGANDDVIWASGNEGLLLRHDRASGAFDVIDTPTEATLYGVWGPSDDLIYAVGGYLGGHAGGAGAVLRVEDGVASQLWRDGLPSGYDWDEMYFKVWGTSDSDVFVVGDRGSVLHYDGLIWTRTALEDYPRMVTVSGSSTDDVVVVGGTSVGVVFQRTDGAWADVSPGGTGPLNGVYVTPSGQAAAAGLFGTVLERVGTGWAPLPLPEVLWDWHGVWIDETGSLYTAGGDFFDLADGALYKYPAEALR